jgi:hypothetical protein
LRVRRGWNPRRTWRFAAILSGRGGEDNEEVQEIREINGRRGEHTARETRVKKGSEREMM